MSTLARLENGELMAVIELPIHGIVVKLTDTMGGSITSNLHHNENDDYMSFEDRAYNSTIDGVEALILAHACAGLDITTPEYIKGIETALDKIADM